MERATEQAPDSPPDHGPDDEVPDDDSPSDERSADGEAPEQVGFVLPAASGDFIAGLQSGLHRFDPHSGAFSLIVEVDADLPDNRLNDGVVDPAGRAEAGRPGGATGARVA